MGLGGSSPFWQSLSAQNLLFVLTASTCLGLAAGNALGLEVLGFWWGIKMQTALDEPVCPGLDRAGSVMELGSGLGGGFGALSTQHVLCMSANLCFTLLCSWGN